MDEAEWLRSTDVWRMRSFVRGSAPPRKLRLFGCACARRAWDQMKDGRSRAALEVAERHADGLASDEELQGAEAAASAAAAAQAAYKTANGWSASWSAHAAWAAACAAHAVTREDVNYWPYPCRHVLEVVADRVRAAGATQQEAWSGAQAAEEAHQAGLLRDLFLPFGGPAIEPNWRTPVVRALVSAIYQDRSFAEMPALADALEDAGCAEAAVLGHCRGPGPHTRGCWLLDLLLAP